MVKRLGVFKVKLGETKYISLREASNILNLHLPAILKFVEEGRINGITNAAGKLKQVNIEYQSLIEYKTKQENYVSTHSAAEILGVPRQTIVELFNHDILMGYYDIY